MSNVHTYPKEPSEPHKTDVFITTYTPKCRSFTVPLLTSCIKTYPGHLISLSRLSLSTYVNRRWQIQMITGRRTRRKHLSPDMCLDIYIQNARRDYMDIIIVVVCARWLCCARQSWDYFIMRWLGRYLSCLMWIPPIGVLFDRLKSTGDE